MHLPRIVIAGTESGVGKTTVTLGIMAALTERGRRIAPFKVGPDYIDPGFHASVTGRPSRNLDVWLLTEETVRKLFIRNSCEQDLSIVEGVMGLYDGRGTGTECSTAHVAKVLRAPVVLVIDGGGIAASAAAKVWGYRDYDPEVRLAGVIINRVGSEAHYQLLREVIERDTGIRCYGYLLRREEIHLPSRHLGLVPGMEDHGLQNKMAALAAQTEVSIDLDGLVKLADSAVHLAEPEVFPEVERQKAELRELGLVSPYGENTAAEAGRIVPRIAVAYDEAFHFYYQDNLDLLEELGAELIRFSPLRDPALPEEVDGLYIGGGFPEEFAAELEENASLRVSIASAVAAGLPTYAECGGLMYLSRAIQSADGRSHAMVGAVPAEAVMTNRLQNFGYVTVTFADNLFQLAGTSVPGHEFHYTRLVAAEELPLSYTVQKRNREWSCGVAMHRMLAGYPHLHFYSEPRMAAALIRRCWEYHLLSKGERGLQNEEVG